MTTTARLFRWGAYYETGVEEVDRQHQEVAGLLNDLYEAWLRDAPRKELRDRLGALIIAVTVHFDTEERIMAEHGYPDLELHRSEHNFLANHVTGFHQELEVGTAEFSESMMGYLKDWLRNHILVSDKRLGAYLAAR